MEDLLLLLLAVLISLCYNIKMSTHLPMKQAVLVPEMSQAITNHKRAEERTADIIKERLIKIYHENIPDKREKIVNLLVQLERVEDPDVFFDENDHIRSFIFSS